MSNGSGCFYCTKDQALDALMTEICELGASTVYLFNDQTYPGRCVVALKSHKTELFELGTEERARFFDDVAKVSQAIVRVFGADKMNYAIYGDTVPHVHVHLVPKKSGADSWGGPFRDTPEKTFLPDQSKVERVSVLHREINALNDDRG